MTAHVAADAAWRPATRGRCWSTGRACITHGGECDRGDYTCRQVVTACTLLRGHEGPCLRVREDHLGEVLPGREEH